MTLGYLFSPSVPPLPDLIAYLYRLVLGLECGTPTVSKMSKFKVPRFGQRKHAQSLPPRAGIVYED